MTLPTSGQLDMNWINAEFGRGLNLGAYLSTQWWMDNGSTGYFSANNLGIAEFYGKRATPPIQNGIISLQGVGGSGPSWTATSGLGTEHASRVIVVTVSTGDTTGSPISRVRLDGVDMTFAARSSGSGSMRACAVAYMHKPTGTSATIIATNSNNASGCIITVFAIYPANPAPASADSGSTTATSCNAALTIPAGGFGVFISHHRNGNPCTMGGTLAVSHTIHHNAAFGGAGIIATSFSSPGGASGTCATSWAGAVNGSCSGATWGPM